MWSALSPIVILTAMIVLPQAAGIGVRSLVKNRALASWLGPITATVTFAAGWYTLWSIPTRHVVENGGRVCGAAGALLILPLIIFTPVNALLAAAIRVPGHRRDSA
jgi:hypothetical protein